MTGERFRDDGRPLQAFLASVDVVCPRCGGAATVLPVPEATSQSQAAPGTGKSDVGLHGWSSPRRLTCLLCGLSRPQTEPSVLLGAPVDPYLRLPLLLAAAFREKVFWAYNSDHLTTVGRFVAADIRERPLPDPDGPRRPMSMIEKLPSWITAAGDRQDILRLIERLSAKLT